MVEIKRNLDITAVRDFPHAVNDEPADGTLLSLIMMVEELHDGNFSPGIILIVPGGVIQGQLSSKRRWYEHWLNGIDAVSISPIATRYLRALTDAAGRVSDDGSFIDHVGQYVHVVDGCLMTPNSQTNRMPWRVRLDKVSAWSMGGM